MTEQVVVLGSGYAGAGAVRSLEDQLDGEADIVWVSDTDHHLVLHESHRCISDPDVAEKITIPIDDIKSPRTEYLQGTVDGIDVDDRTVHLEDGPDQEYDYLLVGIGSRTAFFGIDGLQENSHTLKSLDDALGIHEDIKEAAYEATRSDPAHIVIGGAGLSGIQSAGEVAKFRDEHSVPIEISLVEGLDEIFPGNDDSVQQALRSRLEDRNVNILTGDFISEVDEERAYLGEDEELDYDVLLWTGGITGRDAVTDVELEKDDRNKRVNAGQTFQTSNDRVFAIGDAALIEQNDDPAPPTAQAAWQAAEVAGENIAREIRGQSLKQWTYDDKGTVISVGEDAVAHDVSILPFVDTFGGFPARTLKKGIAARWIASVTSVGTAAKAWPDM
ncbi:NAD(P)/FAD-dependent oxidoreductase [Halovenus rubra]|uniref:NAD(P)/FAD-dependent oxidoreductase n=2 Tax=Halovenus rubra TaxID=869890 RepID=A0ABD5XCX4_9EURY|nr:NAD(P)/FAD-dependent oxidoreductase [Halovenus rubra]